MRLLALCLFGCPAVFEPGYDTVRDLDGDGAIGERFGGPDCRDDDPSVVVCDDDGDGVRSYAAGGLDCDDADPDVFPGAPEHCNERDDDCDGLIDNQDPDVQGPVAFWRDRDGDGAGDPDEGFVCQDFLVAGDPSTGLYADDDRDCDDRDFTVGPHADEVCDGIDNDCDGVTDDVGLWMRDEDGDGFGLDGTLEAGPCVLQPDDGVASVGGDCDDTDASIAPGAPEVPYDGVDQACNGGQDDWDADYDGFVPHEHWTAAQAANDALPPDARWHLLPGDCDDLDPRVNDGALEVCDGVDNDCDGTIDTEDLDTAGPTEELALRAQLQTWYVDADGDGDFGTAVLLCPDEVDTHHSPAGDDCFDGGPAPAGYLGADPALVGPSRTETCDGYDDDCDGRVDFDLASFPGSQPLWLDNDGDGHGAAPRFGCAPDASIGLVDQGGDCNDAAANVFPGAPEICGDAIRQDCSAHHIFDCDGDGAQGLYVGGGDGTDCEDTRADVNPSVTVELCDGLDNDCDGLVDSADTDDLDAGSEPLWFPDLDGDGFGFDDGSGVQQCDQPVGRAPNALDCDDTDATLTPATRWYADTDGDGFGDPSAVFTSCTPPTLPPTVRVAGDCDDTQALFRPGARWSYDGDGDGSGAIGSQTTFCRPPVGEPWVAGPGTDCDDLDATRFPGAPDVPDGVDNDCDGVVDGASSTSWYVDADGDGYGEQGSPALAWAPGRAANDGDCDDTRAAVNPGAQIELCNGRDDNCDGFSVAGSPDVSNPWQDVAVPGDDVRAYVGAYAQGASLDLVVVTCDDALATQLDTPDGPVPLIPLEDIPFPHGTGALTCADGSIGIPVFRDRDGDHTPGVSGIDDFALACPDAPPGFIATNQPLDCAPDDPTRYETLVAGRFGDRDGDGVPGGWSVPGACIVGDSTNVIPTDPDCDDDDPSVNGRDADGHRVQVPPAVFARAASACDHAELALQGDATLNLDSFTGRSDLDLTITGPGDVTIDLGTSGQLVGSLTFRDVDLTATDPWPTRGTLVFERVQGHDLQLVVEDGTVEVLESDIAIGADPWLDVEAGEVRIEQSIVRDGSFGQVSGGLVRLDRSTLANLDAGILVAGGSLQAEELHLEQVLQPVTVISGDAALDGVTAFPPNSAGGLEAQGGSLRCVDCRFDGPGSDGPFFRASGGQITLEDVWLRANAVNPLLEVTAGTLDVDGLEASGYGRVLENAARATVRRARLLSPSAGPVLEATGDAERTTLEDVELATTSANSDGVLLGGGRLDAVDLRIRGFTRALDLQEASGPFVLDDLQIDAPDQPGATSILADGGQLTLRRPILRGTQGVAIETSASPRIRIEHGIIAMTGSADGLNVAGGAQVTLEDSVIQVGDVGLHLDDSGEGLPPSLVMRRSRLFVSGTAPALEVVRGAVTVEQSLIHGPTSTDLVTLSVTPTVLDRVTLTGSTGNVVTHQDLSPGAPLLMKNTLITAPFGDGTQDSVVCLDPVAITAQDVLSQHTPGCPMSGTVFLAPSLEVETDLDATFLPESPEVRPWFGEAAFSLPYPGGF